MSVEIGSTVEGTIVRLAEYGAIVRLQGGKTGLIHISEIADTYVRDVRDFFRENDRVRVRILSVNDKGRYELSTKNVEQPAVQSSEPREKRKPAERSRETVNLGPDAAFASNTSEQPLSFEEQLNVFMKHSQERLLDLKRNLEAKRGSTKRR